MSVFPSVYPTPALLSLVLLLPLLEYVLALNFTFLSVMTRWLACIETPMK